MLGHASVRGSFKNIINSMGYTISRKPNFDTRTFNPTMLNKRLYMGRLMEKVVGIEGDIVECGVGSGKSLSAIMTVARYFGRSSQIYACDSYEGLPEYSEFDGNYGGGKGYLKETIGGVKKFLSQYASAEEIQKVRFVKGYFADSLPTLQVKKIAFLHADADLYQSYLDVLNNLYPKVVSGGVICFDEYLESEYKWPGGCKAIDEFFGDNKDQIIHDRLVKK
jgi:O-methyltransferase